MATARLSRRTALAAAALVACLAPQAHAQDAVTPNAHLQVSGMPPVPATLMRALAPYAEFRPRSVASWHPTRREVIVSTRAGNTVQLHRVSTPGGDLTALTDFSEPVRRNCP